MITARRDSRDVVGPHRVFTPRRYALAGHLFRFAADTVYAISGRMPRADLGSSRLIVDDMTRALGSRIILRLTSTTATTPA
jgi:hypothetical protein